MATDSGTYDDATLARRYAMAQALMQQKEPIKHWAEGLGSLAESALGGYQMSKLDDERRAERASEKSDLYTALGLSAPTAAVAPSEGGFQKLAAILSGGGGGAPAEPVPPPMAPAPTAAPVQMAEINPGPAAVAAPVRAPIEPIPDIIRTNPDGTIAGNITAPTIPAPTPAGAKVAAALSPASGGSSLPASPTGGALGDIPADKKLQLAQMLTSRNPTVKGMGQTLLGNYTKSDAPTDETKEYKLAQSQGYKGTFVDFKTDLKKAGATNVTTNVGGGSDKQIFDAMDESAKDARSTAAGLTGLREARNAVQSGAILGSGADIRLSLQKVGALLGVADPAKIVNTETFRAAIAPQVAAMIKSTVGTTNISNTDREFAEKAAGGNINLDEKSIARLMDIMERAAVGKLSAHQKKVEKIYPDAEKYGRERALFGVDMPAAQAMTAPDAVASPAQSGVDPALLAEIQRRKLKVPQ
jgi:hypothetical protein